MKLTLDLIKKCPIFADLSDDGIELLRKSGALIQLEAGARLFEPGFNCEAMPILLEGTIRVFASSSQGREITLYRVSPNRLCILTISSLLAQGSYSAFGETETKVQGISVPKHIFMKLIADEPVYRKYIFDSYAQRMTELMMLLNEITFKRLDDRLASFILHEGPLIAMSHQEIADELGSIREVVSRLLKQFEENGWISLSRKQIQVTNSEKLIGFIASAL